MGKERLYWKKGFIERKALLKGRLYWKKDFIERKAERKALLKNIIKFRWNYEIG